VNWAVDDGGQNRRFEIDKLAYSGSQIASGPRSSGIGRLSWGARGWDDWNPCAADEMNAWRAERTVLAISPAVLFLDDIQIPVIQSQPPELRC
jgi:hypothetical protein